MAKLTFDIYGNDHASQAFGKVADSVDRAESSMKRGTKTHDEYGKGLEKAGEGADKAEQRTLGLKDTVDGLATIMQGPGKQGIAAYLQGWADLASGVANFIVPSIQAAAAMSKANLAAGKAAVSQKLAAAASKAWAVAQGVLNAVMSANPVLLVVVAVAALVAGFIIAYKHSETFRRIVDKLWAGLKTGAQAAISFVLGMVDKYLAGLSLLLRAAGHLPGPLGAPFRKAGEAVDAARGKVRALQEQINGTHGKTVNVAVNTGPSISRVRSISNALSGLHDRTVLVNVVRGSQSGLGGFNTGGGYARGTSSASPGWHWVGERGPELMRFRGGEQVLPAEVSAAATRGGAGSPSAELLQPIQLTVDGKVLQQVLLRVKRNNGGLSLGLA